MATGVLASPLAPMLLSANLSTLLSSATGGLPSDDCNAVGALPVPAGRFVATTPSTPARTVQGTRLAAHDGQWFERIHVVPRTMDLGNVLSPRVFTVEVWNAHRAGYRLDHVGVTGPGGITVDEGAAPRWFAPLHSELHTVRVAPGGSGYFSDLLTWIFQSLAAPGADLTVTGTRQLVFSARPGFSPSMQERVGFVTDVITARDKSEQRIQVREIPDRELRFTVTLVDGRDVGDVAGRLFVAGADVLLTPYWPDMTPLTAAASPSDTALWLDTTTRTFAAGDVAVLWRDQWNYQAVTIDTVFADHLTLTQPLGSSWPAGTTCAPSFSARLLTAPSMQRLSGDAATTDLAFSEEVV